MWTLILVFVFNTGMASSTVPGYKSEAACGAVAKSMAADNQFLLTAACVEVKK